MPPRRSARHSAAAPPPVPAPVPVAAPPPPPRTAFPRSGPQIAWNISEIRREILHLLPPADLARTLRTEKGCMRDVAGVLYRKMTYAGAEKIKSVDPARKAMYIQAITELDARSMEISPAMRQLPGWNVKEDGEFVVPNTIELYRPGWFNFVVPYLRDRYRGLRKIRFGFAPPQHAGRDKLSCTVTFDTAVEAGSWQGADAYDDSGYRGKLSGHILCNWMTMSYNIEPNMPQPLIQFPAAPEGKYTIQNRFDLRILSYRAPKFMSETAEKWRTALREQKAMEDISGGIEILHLPVSLDLLAHMYKRQAAAGHADRLQRIWAYVVDPWRIDAFESFARVVSTLTSLDLSGIDKYGFRPLITFRDLPSLVSIIRAHLPKLSKLVVDVDRVEDAEAVCKEQLHSGSISPGGTIKELRIGAGAWDDHVKMDGMPPFFNAIRILSAICAPRACISISDDEEEDPWSNDQTAYLQYLLRQPASCRRHLSTVDFFTLGITKYRDVLLLGYDAEGRPVNAPKQSAEKSITTTWLEDFVEASADMDDMDEGGYDDCAEAFEALDEIAGGATVREKRMRAKKLLKIMIPLKERVEALNASLDVEAVQQYIASLGE